MAVSSTSIVASMVIFGVKEEAAYRGVTEADGRVDDVETAMRAEVILHVEAYVRRLMERGEDPFAFAERLLRENPEAVAAADEIGCGIVPADAFLREVSFPRLIS